MGDATRVGANVIKDGQEIGATCSHVIRDARSMDNARTARASARKDGMVVIAHYVCCYFFSSSGPNLTFILIHGLN